MSAREDAIDRQVRAFTAGDDPNPGGRFPTGSYLTPDEAAAAHVAWVARPGEPQDLSDPYHYQTPDQARALGRNWATQDAFLGGRGPAEHVGVQALARAARPGSAAWAALQGYGYDDYAGPINQFAARLYGATPQAAENQYRRRFMTQQLAADQGWRPV